MTDEGIGLIVLVLGIYTAVFPRIVDSINRSILRTLGFSDRMIERASIGVIGTRIMGIAFALIGLVIYRWGDRI